MIFLVVTVGKYNRLLDKFLKYYSRIGIKNFLIILQGNDSGETVKVLKKYNISPVLRWKEEFSEDLKVSYERDVINKYCNSDDWIVYTDLDEFQYHKNIEETVKLCEKNNKKFLYGRLIDRISKTGELIEIEDKISLEKQFPLCCYLTSNVLKGWDRKIVLAKKDFVIGGGHHLFLDKYTFRPLKYVRARKYIEIHHFKWDISVLNRISYYLKYKHSSLFYWKKEMQKFVEYFERNNKRIVERTFQPAVKLYI